MLFIFNPFFFFFKVCVLCPAGTFVFTFISVLKKKNKTKQKLNAEKQSPAGTQQKLDNQLGGAFMCTIDLHVAHKSTLLLFLSTPNPHHPFLRAKAKVC